MTDIPKELIEAVRSGQAPYICSQIIASCGILEQNRLFALCEAIVAERESRAVQKTVLDGDVLSDVLIPCDCTPFSPLCRRLRGLCKRDGVNEDDPTVPLQDVASAVDAMFAEIDPPLQPGEMRAMPIGWKPPDVTQLRVDALETCAENQQRQITKLTKRLAKCEQLADALKRLRQIP